VLSRIKDAESSQRKNLLELIAQTAILSAELKPGNEDRGRELGKELVRLVGILSQVEERELARKREISQARGNEPPGREREKDDKEKEEPGEGSDP
jgi:hypothetical protein